MSPNLPVTPQQIADAALEAAEAGAAIVHLHARNPVDGRPDQSPEAFEPFLRVIRQRSEVVVNLTTGGSPFMQVAERIKPGDTMAAGNCVTEYGLDEFRAVSDAEAIRVIRACMGARYA